METLVTGMYITLPEGTSGETETSVDFSSLVPSGKSLIGAIATRCGTYVLPYIVDGTARTYVFGVNTNDKTIVLKNRSTAWNHYWLEIVLFLQ
jgi:hypothetical protein